MRISQQKNIISVRKSLKIPEWVPDTSATRFSFFQLDSSLLESKKPSISKSPNKLFQSAKEKRRILIDPRMKDVFIELSDELDFKEFEINDFISIVLNSRTDFERWITAQRKSAYLVKQEINQFQGHIKKAANIAYGLIPYTSIPSLMLEEIKNPILLYIKDQITNKKKSFHSDNINNSELEVVDKKLLKAFFWESIILLLQGIHEASLKLAPSAEYPTSKYAEDVWNFRKKFSGDASQKIFCARALSSFFINKTKKPHHQLVAKTVSAIFVSKSDVSANWVAKNAKNIKRKIT